MLVISINEVKNFHQENSRKKILYLTISTNDQARNKYQFKLLLCNRSSDDNTANKAKLRPKTCINGATIEPLVNPKRECKISIVEAS